MVWTALYALEVQLEFAIQLSIKVAAEKCSGLVSDRAVCHRWKQPSVSASAVSLALSLPSVLLRELGYLFLYPGIIDIYIKENLSTSHSSSCDAIPLLCFFSVCS